MEKKIEDYLHLYLGCECKTPWGVLILSAYQIKGRYKAWFKDDYKSNKEILNKHCCSGRSFYLREIKPIFRPLSDMTEEEMKEILLIGWPSVKEIYPNATVKFHNNVKKNINGNQYSIFKEPDGDHFATGTLSFTRFSSDQFTYLLSKNFDLFGLIEAGLAIDAKTIKQ